jgi:hypothetical protein
VTATGTDDPTRVASERLPYLVLRNAVSGLAAEARQAAAGVRDGTADHDFYVGVASAADRRIHPGLISADDEAWLARQTPPFRDGYLEASTLIATAAADPPAHLPLPVPGSRGPARASD